MRRDKKIGLLIPPAYDPDFPTLGTPALLGFLHSKGIEAFQRDLNMSFMEYVDTKNLGDSFRPSFRKKKIQGKVYYYRALQHQSVPPPGFSTRLEENPGTSFGFTEKILSSKALFPYIADRRENHFVDFFEEVVRPGIKPGECDLIGFSITSPAQVLAAFTFGYLLKKAFPELKIVIGGFWVSFFSEELETKRRFSRFFDFAITGEGETPLVCLTRALRKKTPLSAVPNLIYYERGGWRRSPRRTEEDMDELPPPNYDGLPLKEYPTCRRKLTLTFETSRGCYWNRCIYCTDLLLPRPRYREKRPDLVIRDVKHLTQKYGARRFRLSNLAFSPGQMKEFSRRILQEGIRITWRTLARFDDRFDKKTLELAKRAGCSSIGFGLETISQRLLDFIKKGTRVAVIKRIVSDAHDLGLGIYFQTMIGIPSETREEALDTIAFLTEGDDTVSRTAAFNVYYLNPKSEVFSNPEKYGIHIQPHPRLPFRYYYPFDHTFGNIDRSVAQKLINVYSILRRRTLLRRSRLRR